MRLDPDLLDPRDPFELDPANRPHLIKHETFSEEDLWDVWVSNPLFVEADPDRGDADWLMVAAVPGGDILVVPIAKPQHEFKGNPTKCRPIGLDRAKDADLIALYLGQQCET